ncbi:PIN domain-containing protein [Leptospira borgpetersenii]|uniref:PIN domain protein n=2 Tax=Leptospira borgpetersenii TaxID=174 RepID=Q04QY4_LEPBJ|nr:PIN domain-containing protein [Leptospira borgpetersenii]EMO64114.1 PIN domain protein [Leptospira borgpetersenii serovar Pomona str. 200901868]ABJ76686.1 PIN domain protein [Leptospira borgpetersenii serovar Hardjo-bovis str. JB197]ABJ79603.1 PIN domain protein [Leptospira borgpetersenii serovar Hardjo-bovis str. L550]AMX58951.1 pilus biogenesis protein [Leptospira borgpetersenii serovar Hardjo]AMX62205.1 pilus biogenesis protein [Leptospira borgpetersenii serovar Hardjo]
MILVDTSVWIEFFRGNEPYFSELKELIESSEVLVHEVVFGELLQGCKNKNEVSFILEYWKNLNTLTSDGSFLSAGKLSFESKHIDKGIGLIDSVLINEVKSNKLRFWTLDKKILNVLDKKEIYSSRGKHVV